MTACARRWPMGCARCASGWPAAPAEVAGQADDPRFGGCTSKTYFGTSDRVGFGIMIDGRLRNVQMAQGSLCNRELNLIGLPVIAADGWGRCACVR